MDLHTCMSNTENISDAPLISITKQAYYLWSTIAFFQSQAGWVSAACGMGGLTLQDVKLGGEDA